MYGETPASVVGTPTRLTFRTHGRVDPHRIRGTRRVCRFDVVQALAVCEIGVRLDRVARHLRRPRSAPVDGLSNAVRKSIHLSIPLMNPAGRRYSVAAVRCPPDRHRCRCQSGLPAIRSTKAATNPLRTSASAGSAARRRDLAAKPRSLAPAWSDRPGTSRSPKSIALR